MENIGSILKNFVRKNIYRDYGFIGIPLDEFNSLYNRVLKDYEKSQSNKSAEDFVLQRLRMFFEEKIKHQFTTFEGSLNIINNFIKNRLISPNNYDGAIKQIKKLLDFLGKYDYIPNPDLVIELFNRNPVFNSIIEKIYSNYKSIIKKGEIEKLYDNEILIGFIEIYCMINNIEKIEVKEEIEEEIGEENAGPIKTALRSYLDDIAKFDVLTKEEEVELFRRIQDGDESAKEEFIKHNLRLVVPIAKRYNNYGVPLIDLIFYGNIGLIIAVKKFKPEKGYKFSTYATSWIKRKVYAGLLTDSKLIKLPQERIAEVIYYNRVLIKLQNDLGRTPTLKEIAKEMDYDASELAKLISINDGIVSLNKKLSDENGAELVELIADSDDTPEEITMKTSLSDNIRALFSLSNLSEKEVVVLKHRFGFDGLSMKTLEQIGKLLGVKRQRIKQIEAKAIDKLRYSPYTKDFAIYMDNPEGALEFLRRINAEKEDNMPRFLRY